MAETTSMSSDFLKREAWDVPTMASPRLFLLAMLLHHRAGGDLFGSLAVTSRASGRLFDVFVLPLFFRTGTT